MSNKWHGGKGSTQRPVSDKQKFSDNWDAIFGKKQVTPTATNQQTDTKKKN